MDGLPHSPETDSDHLFKDNRDNKRERERGVAVSGCRSSVALAAQARGPGFDPRRRHLSFFPFSVSKVYGQ